MRFPKRIQDALDSSVEKGAVRLDQRRPNWFKDIDLRTLNMEDGCLCICGQLYGHYEKASVATVIGGWVRRLINKDWDEVAARYGFSTPPEADEWIGEPGWWDYEGYQARNKAVWGRLERKWKEQIKARLAAEQQVAA